MAAIDTWVYGLRVDDGPSSTWQDVLLARLTGAYADITPGAVTIEAETGLGFVRRYTYFYVRSAAPQFGFAVALFDPTLTSDVTEGVQWCDGQVAPFDTGGIWHERVPTARPLSEVERRALVDRQSIPSGDYEIPFLEWLLAAFDPVDDYKNGERPAVPAVPMVVVSEAVDRRAWLWEARVPSENFDEPPCRPIGLYLRSEDAREYFRWLRTEAGLTNEEKRKHRRDVSALLVECAEPFVYASRQIRV